MTLVGDSILRDNPIRVIDIGASGGIDKWWSKYTTFFQGVLFEPDPREYERLKLSSNNNMIFINSAVSEESGSIKLNLC